MGLIRRRIAKKMVPLSEEKSTPTARKWFSSHLCRRQLQIVRITLRSVASSNLLLRFGSFRIIFVSKQVQVTRRAEF